MKKKSKRIVDDSDYDLDDFEFAEIDQFRLDKEWIQHEKMVGKAGKALAVAKRKLDIAKSALELKEAQIDKRIRNNPQKYDMSKISEGAIKNELVIQMESKSEPGAVVEAKFEVAVIQAAVERLVARGKAISDLIYLFSIQYFAAPKTPRGMKDKDIERMKDSRIPGVRDYKKKKERN